MTQPSANPTPPRTSRGKRIRARIRHAAFTSMPIWLSRGRITRVRHDRPLHVSRRDILIPGLLPSLDGLTITHLSDLHIGKLTTPEHLPRIIEACNALKSDLIAVTGDFIDLSTSYIDPVILAIQALKAPLGVFLVPGNHDYLHSAAEFVARFRQANLSLLLNESVTLTYHGAHIALAGIDYEHSPAKTARMVHRTILSLPSREHTDLTILLAHHPDAFDAARRHGVDLTLAGHTHGGQFILSSTRGKKGSIGLGSIAFRYPRGLYQRGDSFLYVNSGVGSWFPMRVNCPAEVACLTLRAAK